MLKRFALKHLFRLRAFLQEESLAELRRLKFEVERQNKILERLDLFNENAKAVEAGLLSLALHNPPESKPAPPPQY